MESKAIRVGIFGVGRGSSFPANIQACGGKVVALCDMRKDIMDEVGKEIGGDVKLCNCFDDFIRQDMDAVLLTNTFHEHAPYAIRCLEKGIHVLSECTANGTMAEGIALVRAAEKSSALYMLSENYPYMEFNREIRRVYRGGTLGKALFCEGEYNHPVAEDDAETWKTLHYYPRHWRNYLPRTYYITHALAPLMYATGATPIQVSALPCFDPPGENDCSGTQVGDRAAILTTLNNDGSVFRVTGCAAFGGHENSYRLCCERGQIENLRDGTGNVLLRYNGWQIPDGMQEFNTYKPNLQEENEALAAGAGHGGGDFWVIHSFLKHIREQSKPEFDVYFATAMASVGILGHRSLLENGKPYAIPDFRREEDRKQYENDTLTPFWGLDGSAPTIPCCSRQDYKPSSKQTENYMTKVVQKVAPTNI